MKDLEKEVEFLKECSDLCCDEAGEYWRWLADGYRQVSDSASNELKTAIENEIISTCAFIKENYEDWFGKTEIMPLVDVEIGTNFRFKGESEEYKVVQDTKYDDFLILRLSTWDVVHVTDDELSSEVEIVD